MYLLASRASLWLGCAMLMSCADLPSSSKHDAPYPALYGLDPADFTQRQLIERCQKVLPHRRGRRVDPHDKRVTRCAAELEARLIGERLRRMEQTSAAPASSEADPK